MKNPKHIVEPYNAPDVTPPFNPDRPVETHEHSPSDSEDKPGKQPGKLKFPTDHKDPKKLGKGPTKPRRRPTS